MASKYLIVEGLFDKIFFTSLFEKIKIKDVQILMPTENGVGYNGKGNCVILLENLISSLFDGTTNRIALILDADFSSISKQGFHSTLKLVDDLLKKYGFNKKTKANQYPHGIFFNNPKGLPDIGLWIMPDNKADGYLEYFLINSVDNIYNKQLTEANSISKNFKYALFSAHHSKKSELAILMSMLENPGRNLTHVIDKDILDCTRSVKTGQSGSN